MLNYLYTEINVIGIVLLLLMYFNAGTRHREQQSFDQKLFHYMIFANIAMLLLDTGMWLFNGTVFFGAWIANYMVTAIYYFLQPILGMLWLIYCNYKLKVDKKRLSKLLPIYLVPIFVTTLLVLINSGTGWAFYIDQNNIYHRGSFFFVFFLVGLMYFLDALYLTLTGTTKQHRHEFRVLRTPLLFFILLPFVGVLIQSIMLGISLIWICCTFSLLIIFISLQNDKITTDILTGLNNRLRFEMYMEDKMQTVAKDNCLILVMLDVDDFKMINDHCGHLTGDEALRQVAEVLIQSVEQNDFLARFGGDEFVIVAERKTPEDIYHTLHRIDQNAAAVKAIGTCAYKLSLSKGVAVLHEDGITTGLKLIAVADEMMYRDKQLKKQKTN